MRRERSFNAAHPPRLRSERRGRLRLGRVLAALVVLSVAASPAAAHISGSAKPEDKIDPRILAATAASHSGPSVAPSNLTRAAKPRPGRVRVDGARRVQVYIVAAQGVALEDLLASAFGLGLQVEVLDPASRRVQAWVDDGRLRDLAALPAVERIRVPDYGVVRTGSVTSAGDAILLADALRAREGLDGSGVCVGVISDSAGSASLSGAFLSGDLPDPSSILVGANPPGSDEGTAMLEIVHDLAPGADLAFYGAETDLEMTAGIEWLASTAGCDVIVDDLGFFFEPYFEDGPIAAKAADVVSRGVSYHSAAGNEAREHYAGTFSPLPVGAAERHDFGGGDTTMKIMVPGASPATVVLQWSAPFGAAASDYDLVVMDADEVTEVTASRVVQDGNDDPVESVNLTNAGGSSLVRNIVIERAGGAIEDLRMFVLGATVLEHAVLEGSVFGHPAAEGVIAATAIAASDSGHDTVEAFASRGPARIDFPSPVLRPKPDLSSIDGVSVSGQSGFPSLFFGTSAAAPHTAALAALLRQSGLATPAEIGRCLAQGAVDLGAPGFDDIFGAGRADVLAAFDACPHGGCADANADGLRNATDALIALHTAVGGGSCPLCRCDIDGGGKINATDALGILLMGVGVQVPAMCMAC